MEDLINKFLEANRHLFSARADSLIFFSWAQAALEQGASVERIFYCIMKYNIKGGGKK